MRCNYTRCNISRALEKINNSIYILGGLAEPEIDETVKEYTECNPAIETSLIPASGHLPQLERPEEVSRAIRIFFD